MKRERLTIASVVEEVVFGVEDSLVSTVGALTGIAAGAQDTYVVVLAGVVLIFAEAVSMTAGSYLSSKAEADVWMRHHGEEWDELRDKVSNRPLALALKKHRVSGSDAKEILAVSERQQQRLIKRILKHEHSQSPVGNKRPFVAAAVMGASYLLAGFIPLAAYLHLPVQSAILPSLVMTSITLFAFGAWKSRITKGSAWKSGLEMMLVAMTAAIVGFVLGLIVRMILS